MIDRVGEMLKGIWFSVSMRFSWTGDREDDDGHRDMADTKIDAGEDRSNAKKIDGQD